MEQLSNSMLASRPRSSSGMVWFQMVSRNRPLTMSAAPAMAKSTKTQATSFMRPASAMLPPRPPLRTHPPPVMVHMARPSAGERGDERTHGSGRVQQAERPRRIQLIGEEGKQRCRHSEEHRRQINRPLDGLQRPSLEALVPRLIAPQQLPAAAALTSLRGNVGMILGPALGGLVATTTGVAAAYALDVATFARRWSPSPSCARCHRHWEASGHTCGSGSSALTSSSAESRHSPASLRRPSAVDRRRRTGRTAPGAPARRHPASRRRGGSRSAPLPETAP
jgi:hypothetical protein